MKGSLQCTQTPYAGTS